MNELSNKDLAYIKNLETHIENTRQSTVYSIERIDILVISLSTAALGFSMSFVDDIQKIKSSAEFYYLLKLSWSLFGIAIIANLLSQLSSYKANIIEIQITRQLIRKKKGIESDFDEVGLTNQKNILNDGTNILNNASVGAVIIGIIFFVIFSIKLI